MTSTCAVLCRLQVMWTSYIARMKDERLPKTFYGELDTDGELSLAQKAIQQKPERYQEKVLHRS